MFKTSCSSQFVLRCLVKGEACMTHPSLHLISLIFNVTFHSFLRPTGVHGGCQVSRALHLLRSGVCPGLSGSAPVPGARGDPDRWKRSAPTSLSQLLLCHTQIPPSVQPHSSCDQGPSQVKSFIRCFKQRPVLRCPAECPGRDQLAPV